MYTPKRNTKFHDDSIIGRADSPYRLANTSFGQDNDFSAKRTPSTRNYFNQVIEQTKTHQLLTFGGTLPLEIAQCLAPNNNKGYITSKIHQSGWVTIIYSRKLYVWRYVASTVRKAVKCIELQLPSTELKHDASLTCIIESQSSDPLQSFNSKTGLLFISAEGMVQFWQNINRPSMTTVSTLPLNGKQCHSLLSVMPYGCVMNTTSNELYLINPSHSGIHCRQLTSSSGMLSNIGRRVSSFWFQPVVSSDSKRPPCICSATIEFDSSQRIFLVASNENIQRWELTGISEHENRMVNEIDLRKCLKNFQNLLPNEYSDFDSIDILDMKATGYGTMLLIALWKNGLFISILATMKFHESQLSITRVVVLDNCLQEDELSVVKLILPPGDYHVYISTNTKIFAQSVSNSKWDPVTVEFNKASAGLITAGCCANDSVFLTRKYGLVTLKLTQAPEIMLLDETIEKETTAKTANESSFLIDATDCYTGLKSAFVAYSKKNMGVQNLLTSIDYSSEEMHSAIQQISCELLDSSPATDATWAAQRNIGLVTSAVLLLNQLQDKVQIHQLFIEFLNSAHVWEKVGQLSSSTRFYLHENNEKLQSMIALLDMYNRSSKLIDQVLNAIDIDMSEGNEELYLNKKDLFFTKVTDIGRFFSSMVAIEEERLSELATLKEQIDLIFAVSEMFTTCFTAAWQYRLSADKEAKKDSKHVPWTGSSRGFNSRSLLKRQIHLQLEKAVPNVDSTKLGSSLTQQVVLLADIFLDGYECQLSSSSQQQRILSEEYHQERQFILLALVKYGYYEEASKLAEKYEDFVVLIMICEKTKDAEKLQEYKTMFHEQGFSNILYQWYMDKGAWGKLLSQDDKVGSLNSFLVQYEHLSWLQLIDKNDFSKASHVLKHLSNKEDICASRKKIMLVLSHLALLASDEPSAEITPALNSIDDELQLLDYQELIMKILKKDFSSMQPLTANELLELCLDYDLAHATDDDMIAIFQLLRYDEVTKDTGLRLWCKCIEHDRWEDCPQLDYVSVVTQKRFFRCLKRCNDTDVSRALIPNVDDLLACRHLEWSPTIVRQIQACYEVLQL